MILTYDSIVRYDLISKKSVKIPRNGCDIGYFKTRTISPDKAYCATGGTSHKVFLWDIKTMKKVREFKGSESYISEIILLPSSNVIAAGNYTGSVYFWDISTGEFAISPLKGEKDQEVISLSTFQNEENVVIGSESGSIFVYNWKTRGLLARFKAGGRINKIHILKDQKNMIVATKEGKITFWCLITYNQLFHYDIKQEIEYFQLTADEKYLAYMIMKNMIKKKEEKEKDEKTKCDADNLFIMKNPLANDVVAVAEPYSEFSYIEYVMDLINNKGKQYKPENDQWIIMPYRINTLHLYSYFNHPNLLKLALDGGGSLFNTNFGENALSFAIKKQFSGCVSVVVSSFGKILKGNSNALNFISNDCIIGLNKLGYPFLTKFYKIIYTPYTGKFVKFVDESLQTPIYYRSKEIYPIESNFGLGEEKKTQGKPVTCMLTSLPLPLTNGSEESTKFLDSLEGCPNSAIFTTKFIQDILDHKWENLKWAMYWQVII
ncbi:unnamed protein product [Blepharisma stoltei]|uniref:Uncharacterized protein n=1 Tax=Blepharisma stoltei TaxID=1481888 RepID=A0AAU9JIW2_9CILI|nr:unnamed protein product [Blepharisma stoltei]